MLEREPQGAAKRSLPYSAFCRTHFSTQVLSSTYGQQPIQYRLVIGDTVLDQTRIVSW